MIILPAENQSDNKPASEPTDKNTPADNPPASDPVKTDQPENKVSAVESA